MPTYADNRKALHDYEILEKSEAGIVLSGQETKSVRNGQISLKGAYITFHGATAYLTNARISPYKPAGKLLDYDPEQSRRLLLHKREIAYLRGKTQEMGLTVVPISVYNSGRMIKVEIAVARGKHTYDKREAIKKRDVQREMSRAQKGVE
ncbi:MAG: SsrA-binding protein SmpB [bacterium]|nr:SsrA-binding protein SmpB [bacterium]